MVSCVALLRAAGSRPAENTARAGTARAETARSGALRAGARRGTERPLLLLLAAALLLSSPAAARAEPEASDGAPSNLAATAPEPFQIATAATQPQAAPAALGFKKTRFVIGLDKKVEYTVFALSAPNRVIVEFSDARVELPIVSAASETSLVQSLRSGLSAPGRQRVVIDVAAPVVVESTRLDRSPEGTGYHLQLEIAPAAATAPVRAAKAPLEKPMKLGVQPPLPRPAQPPKQLNARAFKPVIVIDPGHGGHDSGARKHGTVEKDVVLAFSKVLREQLEATGRYRVLMTRETDVFVTLDGRRDFGEKHNANLFIAVHADYASTKARGATIYSLRDGVAEQLKKSALRDVEETVLSRQEQARVEKASGEVDAVKGILSDLARRELDTTRERTSIFARTVIENMGGSTNMRDDPDQQAAFRVLKTAQFPSVLIELAYVSNKQDAELLSSQAWRQKVATSIRTAIDNYFSHTRLPL